MNPKLFCPHCGHQGTLVEENDAGDYYHGPNQQCLDCAGYFTDLMNHIPDPNDESAQRRRESIKVWDLEPYED
jgi:hypothetical protein